MDWENRKTKSYGLEGEERIKPRRSERSLGGSSAGFLKQTHTNKVIVLKELWEP